MSHASKLTKQLIDEFGFFTAELIIKEMQKEINKNKTSIAPSPRSETIIKWI